MQVYVSADMEGVAGIATMDQVIRGGHGYPAAQRLMTDEVNAAVVGAFDGGATDVLVNDSHGTMDNLLAGDLDPRARLLIGSPKLDCMAEGLTADHDMALFVGYHAPGGGPGVLAHTFSGYFREVRLNGRRVSEAEINALQAAAVGVPIGFVSGDDVVCGLATERFHGVTTVAVKTSHGFTAADSRSPRDACAAIRAGAASAVRAHRDLAPVTLPDRWHLAIDMPTITAAELGESIPQVRRTSSHTIESDLTGPSDVIGLIVVAYQLANAGLKASLGALNRH